ncbi:MAG TPA: hypothetical protein VJZ27_06500, partial [Aggregatilineales bacterium]|nr:hypothetical protein [Aggregatilineales bacterium]
MIIRWNKVPVFALLMALAGFAVSVHAQRDEPLPALTAIASDPGGVIYLFYPSDWELEPPSNAQTTISQYGLATGDATTQIIITGETRQTSARSFEELPDWLIENDFVTDEAQFSEESYGGFQGWLAHGENMLQEDVYSAVAVMQIEARQLVIVQTHFPAENLIEAAPLVTAILEKSVILPASVTSEDDNLQINLPFRWIHNNGIGGFITAPDEQSFREFINGDAPGTVGILVRFVSDVDSLDELLESPSAVEQARREFAANGVPATL